MNYWLIKSEPNTFSYADLERLKVDKWDGVRNFAARNYLRNMRIGDLALFYHSVNAKEIVGICRVVREHYPDPTATTGDWSAVDFQATTRLQRPVTLQTIKNTPELSDMVLLKNSRLSVQPVTEFAFFAILKMGETLFSQ